MKFSFTTLFVLVFCALTFKETGAADICGGNNVSNFPRVDGSMLDGYWHTHRITNTPGINHVSVYNYQFQGRVVWTSEWKNGTCIHKKYETAQHQSIESPYSPCYDFKEVLPVAEPAVDMIHYMPTKDILLYYRCFGDVREDQSCSKHLFLRVLTRKLKLTKEELDEINEKLQLFGLSDKLIDVDPKENKCRLPMQAEY